MSEIVIGITWVIEISIEFMMKINEIFISIAIAVVFISISSTTASQNLDGRNQMGLNNACNTDENCRANEICKNKKCSRSCAPNSCAVHAWCQIKNHQPVCNCWPRHTGDPYITGCVETGCTSHDECSQTERCENKVCIPVCSPNSCGVNARCVIENRTPVCICEPYHSGDPLTRCEQKNCKVDNDCGELERCMGTHCFNSCRHGWCAHDAVCKIDNHLPTCFCKDGSITYPFVPCEYMSAE